MTSPKPDAVTGIGLRGFRPAFLTIGVLQILLAASMLVGDLGAKMASFGVPPAILASPHYLDAMHWVYTHMLVIGLIIATLGHYAEGARLQRAMARLLFLAHVYYTWLDFRASDSAVGTGLYQGPASLMPAFIGMGFTLVFAWLSVFAKARAA